ncbi:MAG: hypothetical protein IJ613_01055 [Muribaculaceae bacterium]|nr:hypothetical protein [Muribaculaceae bacterium]
MLNDPVVEHPEVLIHLGVFSGRAGVFSDLVAEKKKESKKRNHGFPHT